MLRGLLALLLSAVFVLGGAGTILLWASLPQLDGEQPVRRLYRDVTIERDARGVPTIRATGRVDLARATGFVHAQDRFFQMDLLRRTAAGEMAALIGQPMVEFDKNRRRHRLRSVAQAAATAAPAEDQALLLAYSEGVADGLRALRTRPFEYLALRATPAPWLPEDTLLAVHAMWFDLTDEDALRDRRLAALRAVLPPQLVDFLVPPATEWDTPVAGAPGVAPPLPDASVYDLRQQPRRDFTPPPMTPGAPAIGSNSWAVGGAHAGGRALIANDPHLGLNVPSIWYRTRFVLEGGAQSLDVAGVTLPGTPLMILGSNGHVAWSFTNSYGDWSDAVAASGPIENGVEVIAVKGSDPVTLPISRTPAGPLFAGPGGTHAIRWLAAQPEATNLGLARLEQAQTLEEALAVASRAGIPPQNFVAGDAAGNIGWTIAGRLPRRTATGWDGWLDPADYPRIVNPEAGRIWTANQRIVDGEMLAKIGDGGFVSGARARQIRDGLLALADHATETDMLELQLDDRALFLARWRELLLSLLTEDAVATHSLRAAVRPLVDDWGGRAGIDSVGYRVVREWRLAVFARAMAAITAEVRAADRTFAFEPFLQWEGPLWQLVTQRPPHLLHPDFPSWETFLLDALDALLRDWARQPGGLAARTWGEANTARIQHPLSRGFPALAPLLDLPRLPLPGDANMPRVQGPAFGASLRLVVAPGREARATLHVAGGQSGHPWSPFYRAGFDDWAEGRPTPLLPGPARHVLKLVPARPL